MTRLAFGFALLLAAAAAAAGEVVLVQSTTSTANSGLYDAILPRFEADTGIAARVVAVGTGQALRNARNCDGDVLVVHDPAAEARFVAEGHGIDRRALMSNDFVVIGPGDDPAGIAGAAAPEALARIAAARAPFVSRGDESGTHAKERALWAQAGIAPEGGWHREVGAGMGAALNIAVGMNAYVLSDRASWLAFGNRAAHAVLAEGGEALRNPYSVIRVNPERCPNVRAEAARAFADWLTSPAGQDAIGAYRIGGAQAFTPAAAP